MKVCGVRGGNLYDLEDGGEHDGIFVLPSRLRHVVWIRPGSVVIAQVTNTPDVVSSTGKPIVRNRRASGEIVHALLPDQVRHLRSGPAWPQAWYDVVDVKGSDDAGCRQEDPKDRNAYNVSSGDDRRTRSASEGNDSESSLEKNLNFQWTCPSPRDNESDESDGE